MSILQNTLANEKEKAIVKLQQLANTNLSKKNIILKASYENIKKSIVEK
ncbi:hypothetical protein KGF47_12060 [Clostridioides sp. ZZV13-5731]|nr:hypothetical protein [Clostridioides sp. ZZV14-6044]MCC0751462.1 hypothetical protein [Clostridioides sp. ZZV13-5731]